VCLKPAEQSPACAHAIVEAFQRAGLPPGALALLPGDDSVGAALVAHPGIHTIAFTGSDAVGLQIIQAAASPIDGQRHIKQVIAEMGGKNCVIVDHDADLDDVIPALVDSAFGFAGQKCSAASRVLVHERIAETLTDRLRRSLQTLVVGPAEAFDTDVPPVIDADARDRVERVLADPGVGATLHRYATVPDTDGFWVAPTLVTGAPPDSTVIATELFAPVLSIEPVASIAAACDLVDEQRQALTGGLFTRTPETIAEVIRRSPVGNLYVNRGTTGAVVGRQPFGGNRLSGTGAKTGSPDYLRSFTEALVVTERLSGR
jgi:RHH-type proline utilization regulon transcriptional repressor/proline dehydrogenase/delta 1-pyrroline-5-carboxylate dehydrogenase